MICSLPELNTVAPFLRWAGSKRQLIPELIPFWQERKHEIYVEPFLGAGHLFFAVNAPKAYLSDINDDLINAYSIIKDNPIELHNLLEAMPADERFYYNTRKIRPESLNEINAAARFIYLNRFCYNGLYRTNMSGDFNVPYGPSKSGKLPNLKYLLSLSEKLQTAEITCEDFESIILKNITKGCFFYLDPPYLSKNRIFTSYNGKQFTSNDFERLVNLLNVINESGSQFVLSNLYNTTYRKLYRQWKIKTVSVKRNISGLVKSRSYVEEIIISNF